MPENNGSKIICYIHYSLKVKQGNSVARDLPPTGSEAHTTSPLYSGIRIDIPI